MAHLCTCGHPESIHMDGKVCWMGGAGYECSCLLFVAFTPQQERAHQQQQHVARNTFRRSAHLPELEVK